VAFHAHPDDEVLLTGGTPARLAAEGNQVIIVVACDGVMGRSCSPTRQIAPGSAARTRARPPRDWPG
jgi:LmbE family N-acetylglucosaminyl deacetylase